MKLVRFRTKPKIREIDTVPTQKVDGTTRDRNILLFLFKMLVVGICWLIMFLGMVELKKDNDGGFGS